MIFQPTISKAIEGKTNSSRPLEHTLEVHQNTKMITIKQVVFGDMFQGYVGVFLEVCKEDLFLPEEI